MSGKILPILKLIPDVDTISEIYNTRMCHDFPSDQFEDCFESSIL